jgi:Methyltransferase domain
MHIRRRVSPLAFSPALAEMVGRNAALGRSGKVLDLGSLSTINNLLIRRRLHLATKASRTLEIGLAVGGSCLVFTQTHKDLGAMPEHQHVAIDPFQRSHWIDEAGLLAIERENLSGYLDFREDYSCYILPELIKAGAKFNLVYVDGSHLFEDVFLDFYYVARLLEDGGIMLFDDSTNPHIHKVLHFLRRNLASSLPEFDLAPYRAPHKAGITYRIAHALGRTQLRAFRRIASPVREWNSAYRDF